MAFVVCRPRGHYRSEWRMMLKSLLQSAPGGTLTEFRRASLRAMTPLVPILSTDSQLRGSSPYRKVNTPPISASKLENVTTNQAEEAAGHGCCCSLVDIFCGIWNEPTVAILQHSGPRGDAAPRLAGGRSHRACEGTLNPGHVRSSELSLLQGKHWRTRHHHGSVTREARRARVLLFPCP